MPGPLLLRVHMEELFNWIRPILSGLAAALVVWLMVALTKRESKREGRVRHLSYGKPFKVFSALLVPFAAFVVYAASHSAEGQEVPAFLVAASFTAAAIFLPYQAFFVEFSYDDDFIYYKSPLSGAKQAPWHNLVEVGYSRFLQADYLVVEDIGKIWCSNMLNGYAELGEFLEEKVRELYPEES